VATASILLSPGAATLPDNTTNNLSPQIVRVKSTGTAPAVYYLQLAYDTAQEEWATWQFRMPNDYASGLGARITYNTVSAITGGVAWDLRFAAYTPAVDTTSMTTKVFGAANTSTQTVPGTTAGKVGEVLFSAGITNTDSIAAGDFVIVRLARAVANASDTAAGDVNLLMMTLFYTTV
jgi:hypothetical protein